MREQDAARRAKRTPKNQGTLETLKRSEGRLYLSAAIGLAVGYLVGLAAGNFVFTVGTGLGLGLAVGILLSG